MGCEWRGELACFAAKAAARGGRDQPIKSPTLVGRDYLIP